MRPEQPPAQQTTNLERLAWMLRTLRAAVARACPADVASLREDLVQVTLVRVLEHAQPEQNRARTASDLWRVAFSVIADELRRRRAEEQESRRSMAGEAATQAGATPPAELGVGIRDCVGRLAAPRRLAVMLRLEGFRAEEASRVLHWDVKKVQNLTYRGLADLRLCLEQKGLTP